MSFDNMFGTGMGLGQFGFMDEMEGSGREAAVAAACDELRRIHQEDPYAEFDDVIDFVLESRGLNPQKMYSRERKMIDACSW